MNELDKNILNFSTQPKRTVVKTVVEKNSENELSQIETFNSDNVNNIDRFSNDDNIGENYKLIDQVFDLEKYIDPEIVNINKKPLQILCLGVDERVSFDMLSEVFQRSWLNLTWSNHVKAMKFSFPRDIPKHYYPFCSQPYFSVDNSEFIPSYHVYDDSQAMPVASFFENFKSFVIPQPRQVLNEYLWDTNYMAGYLIGKLVAEADQNVWIAKDQPDIHIVKNNINLKDENFTQKILRTNLTNTNVNDLMINSWGSMRLLYSYRLNFAALTMKLIDQIMHIPTEKADELIKAREVRGDWGFSEEPKNLRLSEFKAGQVPKGLDDPLTLQLLYALKRVGTLKVHNQNFKRAGTLYNLLETSSDGKFKIWTGSGEFKPRSAAAIGFKKAEGVLIGLRLIQYDFENENVSLTPRGFALLEKLDPFCEDPDIILKWRDPRTDSIHKKYQNEVDEWIINHFMAVKKSIL